MVLEVLAEETVSLLVGAVASLLKEQVDLVLGAKDDLKELQKKLEYFQVVIKAADCKPFFSSDRDRDIEGKFKDVFYDAEDIIEEYQTKIGQTKREEDSAFTSKVRKPWIPLCSCFKKHVSFPYELANKIKGINQRLDIIKKDEEMKDLLDPMRKASGNNRSERDNRRETTHHILEQPPVGREEDKRKVNELLFGGSSAEGTSVPRKDGGVSIVCIVGLGGVGKTTLAKTVFDEAEERFKERRWWVCVSQKPDLKSLLQKILKQVCKGQLDQGITSLDLNELYTRLKSKLSESKFLLVLDDVWELEDWWWGNVRGTLKWGPMGSKILITSRKEDVSQGMGAEMYKLPVMTSIDSWNLFLEKAQKEEKELASHGLVDIAKKMVDKCGGLPLVVQTVGCLMGLKRMMIEDWERVEKSQIWEWRMPASSSSSQYGGILPGLILSYDDLPHHYLKSCFVEALPPCSRGYRF